MKYFIRIVSIIGLISVSQLAYPDSITDTYNTGDTLTATTLRNIKSAVNDNDSRITALEAAPKANTAITAPTAFDDINAGFPEGSVWVNMTSQSAYILVDSAPGSAVWKQITNVGPFNIGDRGPAGGIVFYITDQGMHGLEAAPGDQGPARWGCESRHVVGALGTVIGTGAQNTADILAGCGGEPGIAARVAADYMFNGFDDWFLPSQDELSMLHRRGVVGCLDFEFYWSSTRGIWNIGTALGMQCNSGDFLVVSTDSAGDLRPVRAF
jgi:hypothetical protein